MKQPSRTRALRRIGLSSAVAATVLAGGIGVAGASTHSSKPADVSAARTAKDATTNVPAPMPPGRPGGIGGDVTALTSTSITVVKIDGTKNTYAINPSTVVTDLRQSASAASLALGENVHIRVSPSDSTVATSIDIAPAHIGGRVSAVNGDTITVSGPHGVTGTIHVSAATTYAKNGVSASLGDVSAGSFIFAEGSFGSSPTTIDAATIGIGTSGPGDGPSAGVGPGHFGTDPSASVPPGTPPEIRPQMRGVATQQ